MKKKILGGQMRAQAYEYLKKTEETKKLNLSMDELELQKEDVKSKKKREKIEKKQRLRYENLKSSDLMCRLHASDESLIDSNNGGKGDDDIQPHVAPIDCPTFMSAPPKPQFFDIVHSSILCSPYLGHRVGNFKESTNLIEDDKPKGKGGILGLGWFR